MGSPGRHVAYKGYVRFYVGESPGRWIAGSTSQIFQYNVGLHINA